MISLQLTLGQYAQVFKNDFDQNLTLDVLPAIQNNLKFSGVPILRNKFYSKTRFFAF